MLSMLKLTILGLLLACLPMLGTAEEADGTEGEEEVTLESLMDDINDYYKQVGRGLRKPDAAQAEAFAESTQTMIDLFIKCKEFEPPMAKDLSGEARDEHIAAYAAKIDATVESLNELKGLLEAGDMAAAGEFFSQIKRHKKEGHDEFEPED